MQQPSMLYAGPEIAGIAIAVLTAPDADVGLVVAAPDTVIADVTIMVIIVVAEHTGGEVVLESILPVPDGTVNGFMYLNGEGTQFIHAPRACNIKIHTNFSVTGEVHICAVICQV